MRVLLVDDEEELVSALAERLSIRGIEADWVTSGEDALKRIQSKTYDLALLDVKLPRMSGLKLKKLLQEKNAEMKFIFFTGHGSENNFKIGSAEAGAQYYLAKPVNIDLLVHKMNEIFNK
ncbi:MAG: response regulator [Deltaproteobacteria bacterium]|nr:response regulator [Deltaproteobacteria bacterium]MBW2051208.1 response regulator [Deltaproteobacteria bacterium]MBW2139849.1 response regulator [Deltaproteobacteria bacterium]MBW2322014.1 response regulator [Deltaproteobacteria bacterium]